MSCFPSQQKLSYCQQGRRFLRVQDRWQNADASVWLTPRTRSSFPELAPFFPRSPILLLLLFSGIPFPLSPRPQRCHLPTLLQQQHHRGPAA